jgi:putative membrane-bound dehydrogenase-like protein
MNLSLQRFVYLWIAMIAIPCCAVHPWYSPDVGEETDEPEKAMAGFTLAEGYSVQLVAAEPQMANPVAFDIDEKGNIYVAETFRAWDGVSDLRPIIHWLEDDLASRTVDDRLAMMKHFEGRRLSQYRKHADRIRFLRDVDGDGRMDESRVFAGGFDDPLDGIGSGVFAAEGSVWYTCIPHLWRLDDLDGDGEADKRKALQRGYGVHISLLGHDMHGVVMGPDGKLYFSIGDRGLNVKTPNGRIELPDEGSVLRCNPDGSDLEVVARGLRNPQELAFDDYGNLFTVDNDADGIDLARLVYLVEEAEVGWQIGHQWVGSTRLWNREKVWHTQFKDQTAYTLPPVAHITNGPSGLTYNPGTGLLPAHDRHFFVADFTGSAKNSGIYAFKAIPSGAGFQMDKPERFAWGIVATDVDFGAGAGVFVADWVGSYSKPGKGRIYRVYSSQADQQAAARAAEIEIAAGMQGRPTSALVGFLAHADRRVRQAAQFEIVRRNDAETLARVATGKGLKQTLTADLRRRIDEPDKAFTLRQTAWEDEIRQRGSWTRLHADSATSASGADLALMPDGSVLAAGKNELPDTYSVQLTTELQDITALRIEALPDPSHPGGGSGRAEDGSFVVSSVSVSIVDKAIQAKLPTARIVRVQLTHGNNPLSLAEVEVFDDTGVNVAGQGVPTQSSTGWNGPPEKATDGNTDGRHNRGGPGVTHTNHDQGAWWEVDLGRDVPVSKLRIWNRTDCCGDRLKDFKVSLLSESRQTLWTETIGPSPSPMLELTPGPPIPRLALQSADATFSAAAYPAASVVGGGAGWSVGDHSNEAHALMVKLSESLGDGQPLTLAVTIEQKSKAPANLGRFRISATTATAPSVAPLPPAVVLAAVNTPVDQRDLSQQQLIRDHYADFDPVHAYDLQRLEQLQPRIPVDDIWVEDDIPHKAKVRNDKFWHWGARGQHPVYSGLRSHRLPADANKAQHIFHDIPHPHPIESADDRLFTYVYLDPDDLPKSIVIEWQADNWEHRVFYGDQGLVSGKRQSAGWYYGGPLPEAGKWVRLDVEAGAVGLAGGMSVKGMAFTQDGGTVYWDYSGRRPAEHVQDHDEPLRLARLHAMWAMGQLLEAGSGKIGALTPLLRDDDGEVRAQAAKLVGDYGDASVVPTLIAMLEDGNARVQFHAAMALGKLGGPDAVDPLLGLIEVNDDVDVYIRHAGVVALSRVADRDRLLACRNARSLAVRRAAVLALRRMRHPDVAVYLQDADKIIALEAARAIYDMPIIDALPALAAALDSEGREPLFYERAIHANYRLGGQTSAVALARFATNLDRPEPLRRDALELLRDWSAPPPRDLLLGLYRPIERRGNLQARIAAGMVLGELLRAETPPIVLKPAMELVANYDLNEFRDRLYELFGDSTIASHIRLRALRTMARMGDYRLGQLVRDAVVDENEAIQNEGDRILAQLDPEAGAVVLAGKLSHESMDTRRTALASLGQLQSDTAVATISDLLDKLARNDLPAALHLDVMDAARAQGDAALLAKLDAYDKARAGNKDPLARYSESLEGGDVIRGRELFETRQDAQCAVCHVVNGAGGIVGPDLSRIGEKRDRRYLLESIIYPNSKVAEGYENVVLTLDDGNIVQGTVTEEYGDRLKVSDAEIQKSRIAKRERMPSAMPDIMRSVLSKKDLRDLVTYLAECRALEPDNPGDLADGTRLRYYEGNWQTLPDLTSVKPHRDENVLFPEDSHRRRNHKYVLQYEGYLNARDEGFYQFHVGPNDGVEWLIGDRVVLRNEEVGVAESSGGIMLKRGDHRFRLTFFNLKDNHKLGLEYTDPYQHRGKLENWMYKRPLDSQPPVQPADVVHGVQYRYYEGDFTEAADVLRAAPNSVGFLPELKADIPDRRDGKIAVVYSGYVDAPRRADFNFYVDPTSRATLKIAGRTVVTPASEIGDESNTIELGKFDDRRWQHWQAKGTAFAGGPSDGGGVVEGRSGARLAGSSPKGTGSLTRRFRIERGNIAFKIGGGNNPGRTAMNLKVDGRVVRTATGKNSHKLEWVTWDVSEFMGKDAELEIVDQVDGRWGLIWVDQIIGINKSRKGSISLINGKHPFTLITIIDGGPFRPPALRYDAQNMRTEEIPKNRMFRHGKRKPVDPGPVAQGINYLTFLGDWSETPDLRRFMADGSGESDTISADIDTGQSERFGAMFTGYLRVDKQGEYTFYLNSDDGSRLQIGDQTVVDNSYSESADTTMSGKVELHAGLHAIRVHYTQRGGDRKLQVRWQGPGVELQELPASLLFRPRPRDAVQVENLQPGVRVREYHGALRNLPDFSKLEPVSGKTVPKPDAKASQKNNYALRHTGFIDVPRAGEWTFFLTSDDGSRMFIGDQMIVNNDGQHAPVEKSGTSLLGAGKHPITVDFFQAGAGASLTFEVEGPGVPRMAVPESWLFHEKE